MMDSKNSPDDEACSSAEQRTPPSYESDSDDEFFDALVADDDALKEQKSSTTEDETASTIIDTLMSSVSKGAVAEVRTTDERIKDASRNDNSSSDDGSLGSESADEQSERPAEQDRVRPNRTGENLSSEPVGDAEIQDGLRAEAEEEEAKYEDEDDGGLVVDEDAMRELEEQMTEEEKTARREEAQIHKTKGNELFKDGEYADAVYAYSQGLQLCPLCYKKDRSIMYANRAACKVKQEHLEGTIADCTKALELNPMYLKVVLRRAQAYELADKLDDALKDYQRALELDPGCYEARAASMRLPDQIQERNEKLKAEMMSKLKDLGNLCLRPFGLSTDNFQLNQDPSSGSYSVNFTQNPGGNNGK